jgi:hypothetical protein
MKNQWESSFLNNLNKTKEILLLNSNQTNSIPAYEVTPRFLEVYTKFLRESLTNKDSNIYLKDAQSQEFRFLKLIECLNTASLKFQENKEKMLTDDDNEFTSQLLAVNHIIKNSYELTTCIYLLEWLQSIFIIDDIDQRIKPAERMEFRGTAGRSREITLDMFNNNLNPALDPQDFEDHNKILDLILLFIRAGKIDEAQKRAFFHKQGYLTEMLSGGLPFHDFLLDPTWNYDNVDWDLFPPYMKTKEFQEIKEIVSSKEYSEEIILNELNSRFDSVVGNPNWILWLKSNYLFSDFDFNKIRQVKKISSYISGNSKYMERDQVNVYEMLYFKILNHLNTKLIEAYNLTQKLDFNYVCDTNYTKAPNTNIWEIIQGLKNQNIFNEELINVKVL